MPTRAPSEAGEPCQISRWPMATFNASAAKALAPTSQATRRLAASATARAARVNPADDDGKLITIALQLVRRHAADRLRQAGSLPAAHRSRSAALPARSPCESRRKNL